MSAEGQQQHAEPQMDVDELGLHPERHPELSNIGMILAVGAGALAASVTAYTIYKKVRSPGHNID